MSRQTARAAVAAFLTPAAVDGLATCHPYPAKVTNEGDFELPAGGMGGLVYVQLEGQKEKRIALGGNTSGIKWRSYMCVLICIYRSTDSKAEDVGLANDAFLDAIVARLQSDRKIGSENGPSPVFQAGEGTDVGGDDIEVQAALPRAMRGGITQVFSTVRFQIAEMLYA